jgi:hypothetical protein
MNKQIKTYNATDFANYHAGKMPTAEMYALERAALEDDFLADALEGYAYTENQEVEIASIQEKIKGENKDDIAKIIPINKAKNNWFRMAVAAAIVIGLGTVFYTINNKNEAANIAKVETKVNNVTDSVTVIQTEANKINDEVAAAPTELDGNSKEKVLADNSVTYNDQAATSPKMIMPQMPTVLADVNTTTNGNTSTLNFNSLQNNNNIFQYYNDSKTGGPKQLANNKNNNVGFSNNNTGFGNNALANNGTYKLDDRAKFKALTRADSTSFPITMNDNVMEKEQAAPAAIVAPATKSQAEAKLEEVVVVAGNGTKRRKDVASATIPVNATDVASANSSVNIEKTLQGRVSGLNIETAKKGEVDLIKLRKMTTSSLDAFNSYVKKNIKPLFDDKGNEIKGTVKLSFKTNKAGQPIKIKTTQSLSKKADAQAIELLKKATTWPPNKSDRIIVDVVF